MAKAAKPVLPLSPYPAPEFSLPSSDGATVTTADLKGHWTVLFLYPTDDTPTCTQEACDFSAAAPEIKNLGAQLYGLSKDDLKDHDKFIRKYGLTMPLLSDTGTTTIDAFGSWIEKSLYGRAYIGTDRSTFIIDPKGEIQREWRKVRIKGHVDEVVATLRDLMA